MVQAPEGFIVDRYQERTEKAQGTVRYLFQVDMGLNLYITEEAETSNDYLESTLASGLRTLAKRMIERGNEILEGK